MRKDEEGNDAPGTLGEYRDLCEVLGGPECEAVSFLNKKIEKSPDGIDEGVLATDSQMRVLLMPMIIKRVTVAE